jgi:hypothetical protein
MILPLRVRTPLCSLVEHIGRGGIADVDEATSVVPFGDECGAQQAAGGFTGGITLFCKSKYHNMMFVISQPRSVCRGDPNIDISPVVIYISDL